MAIIMPVYTSVDCALYIHIPIQMIRAIRIPGCGYDICLKNCLSKLPVLSNSTAFSKVHIAGEMADWTVVVTYVCKDPLEKPLGSPNRTCHCGDWNDAEPVCKSKTLNMVIYFNTM